MFVPFSLDDEAHDLLDLEGKLLFSRVVKKYGSLEIGECYGFMPALALGGLQDMEFVRRLKAPEHFAIIAQTVDFNLIDVEGYGHTKIV